MSTGRQIYQDPLLQEISRRGFIKATGAGLAASLHVACGAQASLDDEDETTTTGDTEVSEKAQKTYACATCEMRAKAEENPTAFMSRLWKFHTKFCPGWKEYQAYLVSQK